MKRLIVVTGASRGLGAALARETARAGVQQLLIARSGDELADVANDCLEQGATVRVLSLDLADSAAEPIIEEAIAALDWRDLNSVILFNNASQIGPIDSLRNLRAREISRPIALNYGAALWMTSLMLRACWERQPLSLDVVNISTGVSLKPLAGWSVYCTSKAALNLLTASIVEETAGWPIKVRAIALNPGPLDTDMQKQIRDNSSDSFPDQDRFVDLFRSGGLARPEAIAAKVVSLLSHDPFPQGQFIDLRNR